MSRTERGYVTAKFGGTSLKNAERFEVAAQIVEAEPERQDVVTSAPEGVTDLLEKCSISIGEGGGFDRAFRTIAEQFEKIAEGFRSRTVRAWLREIHDGINTKKPRAWVMSRGENLSAKLMAERLGVPFVDTAEVMRRDEKDGFELITDRLPTHGVVVYPGFYASTDGNPENLVLIGRNASDVSGAIVTRGVGNRLYEIWTNQPGMRAANPEIITDASVIYNLTHQEARELAYTGAKVVHPDTIPYLDDARAALWVPIHVRDSYRQEEPGSLITQERDSPEGETVIGIAGKSGFWSIEIEKPGLNRKKGATKPIFDVLEAEGVSYEESPASLDHQSIIVHRDEIGEKGAKVLDGIERAVEPTRLELQKKDMSVICVVGQGIQARASKVKGQLYAALDADGINHEFEVMSRSGNNVIFGVDTAKYVDTVELLYDLFIANSL
ncbi:hypothetical protein A3G67_01560 [Candidatus Roizmanbacteria bacterium RIFCSPLOWO2_12_FULL_40_12]|uniref:Aspartate/glutamate/uridylate kinase domain-containing protein n=1 Tax=Candidatus Roizmanbacteria bacterium RIFCSPLOWO2_01_FULL_40_42 TaxID=1802066 RepID=A0A1F7J6I5_9BACT|nr:MAG: hypothetical protein A2779_02465 [Candidatus Roizmanbacteria bacterium RIFCSPHIGHO2_01_FULL_40_98]OGK29084.1 MAG: hypothetical protein A3C31_03250 [Candidatus Roizmanbacteria bacterium RIFCSPHIGHO2_02_FULL_40_53]OGK29816.1 MAG: hypothetical protein A2W49_04575 [Candidatus Roizmanbacteria bacterium RIFCSPHIGHO2_12_41_18]OGK36225.1 MAG: hypothetical protein A3E69_01290 [Candidatus Roizmanbacteria bacterium RIFCSPHIGHO2_12_FULL_40_130]OGK51224.1 MAG: hypothetical protein A3B50_03330 [Candi